ncbi:TPM domain-containing protein [Simplicispira lacusdiani]|uniref:TPM domain-containing protein n=1 Tax=Simplicispira lacusdiani TaxID=2213010 RepID=UPI001E2D20CA|nr:TPM domain-containing protein [Simplicispira lacusdiani]
MIDQSATLGDAEIAAIESRLTAFEQERGTQIVVLLVATTAPEDIASYANRVANHWRIGRRDVGDGLLLVVAKQDRKLRIEVAKALEGAIPDLAARQIIDEAIAPHFKQGRYATGIDAGLDQLFARIRGEALPAPAMQNSPLASHAAGFDWVDLGIFLFFAVPIGAAIARAVLGRALGTLATGTATGFLAYFITASLGLSVVAALLSMIWGLATASSRGYGNSGGWGGGSFSSGSGGSSGDSGGFSSGGGGDFGGGGASGDW